MKRRLLSLALATALLGPVAAHALPSPAEAQQELAHARADHVAALKSGNPVAIQRSDESLQHAHEVVYAIRQQAGINDKPLARGDNWETQRALERAEEAHEDAVLSGNKEAIARSEQALRIAHENDYAALHPKHTQ